MAKVFLDHLIEIDEVIALIDSHNLDPEEREELVHLVDEIVHHQVLNLILNHLPKEHHQEFISRLHSDPSSKTHLEFIKTKVTVDIESEIKSHASRLKKDLIWEVHKAKLRPK